MDNRGVRDEHGWTGVSEFEERLSDVLGPLMRDYGIELSDGEWNAVCAILGHHLAGGAASYSGLIQWLARIGRRSDFVKGIRAKVKRGREEERKRGKERGG